MGHLHRRTFLAAGAALAVGSPAGAGVSPVAHTEPARQIPIVDDADVVVCGAGPAGVAAAIAAARHGAVTRLLEVNGCLGGVWTAGLLSWILDSAGKTGLTQEILGELETRCASAEYGSSVGYDVEKMKLLLEEMCLGAGVKVRLHTRVVAAVRDASNRLVLAMTESKSGRQAWSGQVFIDTTGDGDLAAHAGCGFDYGQAGTGEAQPMSVIALLTGLDPDAVATYVRGLAEPRGERDPKGRLLLEMRRAGVDPSYARPTLFYIRKGLFCLMANHEYGVSPSCADEVTEATLRGRAEVHKIVEALRSTGGVWRDMQVVATPEHIGVREGRRIHGLYQVSTEDLIQGAVHEDAVCRVAFPVDVHSTDPSKEKGIMSKKVRAKPYDIPYRALIAKDVHGLLMAGRNISGDFLAHSSYRVTGNAVAMGEAAGTAAAVAAKSRRRPQDVSWSEIREVLGRE
jgi:hypothetical protein